MREFTSGVFDRFSAFTAAPRKRAAIDTMVPPACEKMNFTSGQRVAVLLTTRLMSVRAVSVGYSRACGLMPITGFMQQVGSMGCV